MIRSAPNLVFALSTQTLGTTVRKGAWAALVVAPSAGRRETGDAGLGPGTNQAAVAAVVESDGGVEAALRWNSTWDRSPSMPGDIDSASR